MPMGFCYPGRYPQGGDLPPRPECAGLWHDKLLAQWPRIGLTLLVGSYAIDHYLADTRHTTMTETVRPGAITCRATCRCRTRPGARRRGSGKTRGSRRNYLPEVRRRVAVLVG